MARMTGGSSSATSARSAKAPAAAADREARQTEAYWQRAHQRSVDHRIREEQRATRIKQRLTQNAAAAEARTQARAAREQETYWRKAHARTQNERIRASVRAEKETARAAKRAAAESAAGRARFAQGAFGSVGGAGSSTLRAVGGLGMTALSLGGGFAMAGAIGAQMQDSKRAAMLANQSGDPTAKTALLREAQTTKGFTTSESLGAVEQFVTKTGDLGAARSAMPMLGEISLAYGANLEEMGEAAGQAFNVIRDTIQDPIAQMEALRDVMSTLAAQGTLGAVEIKDMARELAGLGAATRKFEGGPVELIKTMGAMAQATVARGGAASSAEATTAVSRFAADIVKSPAQKEFAAMGVDVFSDKTRTKLKDPREIMVDILEKTGGDMTQVEKIMNVESAKALGGFSPLYLEAERANAALPEKERKKKGEAGRAALMGEFDRFMNASASQEEISSRVASMLDEPAMKFQQVMKDFNTTVGTVLLPTVTQLAPVFQELIPVADQAVRLFARLVEAFMDNPLAGIGVVIAGKIAMDIAGAGIGAAAKGAIESALKAMETPGGKGAVGGAIGLGAAIGFTAATVILTAGIVNFESKEAAIDRMGALVTAARTAQTPEELEQIKREAAKIQDENKPGVGDKILGTLGEIFPSPYYLANPDDAPGRGAAESVTGAGMTVKTLDSMMNEIRGQFERVAKDNAVAAQKLGEAGDKLAMNSGAAPNRGNAPSPVKN